MGFTSLPEGGCGEDSLSHIFCGKPHLLCISSEMLFYISSRQHTAPVVSCTSMVAYWSLSFVLSIPRMWASWNSEELMGGDYLAERVA